MQKTVLLQSLQLTLQNKFRFDISQSDPPSLKWQKKKTIINKNSNWLCREHPHVHTWQPRQPRQTTEHLTVTPQRHGPGADTGHGRQLRGDNVTPTLDLEIYSSSAVIMVQKNSAVSRPSLYQPATQEPPFRVLPYPPPPLIPRCDASRFFRNRCAMNRYRLPRSASI